MEIFAHQVVDDMREEKSEDYDDVLKNEGKEAKLVTLAMIKSWTKSLQVCSHS